MPSVRRCNASAAKGPRPRRTSLLVTLKSDVRHMKPLIRKGLRNIVVDEIPAPAHLPPHVQVRPLSSPISTRMETAGIPRDSGGGTPRGQAIAV